MRPEKLAAIKGAVKDGKLVQAAGGIAVSEAQSDKLVQAAGGIAVSEAQSDKLVQAAGGIAVSEAQSDKLGFDWKIYSVNDVVVRKDYIEQENPVGTSAENPIEYTEGMPLINNAFYRVDGAIKVWMDEWVDWEVHNGE